jgi:hypothetical protein
VNLKSYISIEENGIDETLKCLSECLKNVSENLLEHSFEIVKKLISEKDVPNFDYVIRKELWKLSPEQKDYSEMESAYNKSGTYIGDLKTAKFLIEKKGLTKLQPAIGSSGKICSIGFNEKEQKWFGFSHRAIVGFGLSDKIFEEGFGNGKTLFVKHGSKDIKTLGDAKISASRFARYVS